MVINTHMYLYSLINIQTCIAVESVVHVWYIYSNLERVKEMTIFVRKSEPCNTYVIIFKIKNMQLVLSQDACTALLHLTTRKCAHSLGYKPGGRNSDKDDG